MLLIIRQLVVVKHISSKYSCIFFPFGSTTVGHVILVPLVGLAFIDFWITPHSRIVSPTYGDTVYLEIEPMTSMLLSLTSWRLYHETGLQIKYIIFVGIKCQSVQFLFKHIYTFKWLVKLHIAYSHLPKQVSFSVSVNCFWNWRLKRIPILSKTSVSQQIVSTKQTKLLHLINNDVIYLVTFENLFSWESEKCDNNTEQTV